MHPIYMDYAATTPTDQRVVEAMRPFFGEIFGNPSSLHGFGQDARAAMEEARAKIAAFIGAKPAEVVFTSGGTESDNFAIKGVAWANRNKGDHIIISQIEHHAVLLTCRFLEEEGFKVTRLPVDKDGLVDPAEVAKAITDRTILISIMHANNEIGTIEPIAEIGRIAKERKVYFHTDAVQTFGHLPLAVDELNVDLLSASAHKLCGPKGVGLLYIREGTRIVPFMHGGEQESGRRASTQNVPGIVGFGKAVELAAATQAEEAARLTAFRDRFIEGILDRLDGIRLNGHPTRRLPNNVNLSVESIEGEGMILSLDMLGIACSTGSACSSSSLEPSHCLIAIGLPHEFSHGSLRFSLGRYTKESDIDAVLEALPQVVRRLRALSPLSGGKKSA
ncbi:MAG: cysteine desulfurase NifS [Syntrophobacterales bacterium CG03_land_8_20_14_0_80_58_14]|nr:MAG: cysteine desulfurase NifS [Syntrophobacterales bacterium CG03_land_8_20_14_0_80_58_14]